MIKLIKAYFRKSLFYSKYCQSSVNSVRYGLKNLFFYFRYFKIGKCKTCDKEERVLYFVIDPKLEHPGLTDRLKVITCIYYIAKINGFQFKLVFEEPFKLSDYLDCNKVNWIGEISDISFLYPSSKMYAYNGMAKIPHLNPSVKQYICYYYTGKNILEYNQKENWQKIWADCFHELFKPKRFLLDNIEKYVSFPSLSYVSVHLRFVNALEHFEDGYYNSLTSENQKLLIEKCLRCLQKIKEESVLLLLIFSDSNRFLSIVKENGFSVLDGNVNHVSFHSDKDTILKTFIDFYMISRSKKVFRIVSKELYYTTFSYYAAIAGCCDFETIDIDVV